MEVFMKLTYPRELGNGLERDGNTPSSDNQNRESDTLERRMQEHEFQQSIKKNRARLLAAAQLCRLAGFVLAAHPENNELTEDEKTQCQELYKEFISQKNQTARLEFY